MEASRQSKMSTYLEELETLPILHVLCTFNNTYINICDHTGRILTWKSAVSVMLSVVMCTNWKSVVSVCCLLWCVLIGSLWLV